MPNRSSSKAWPFIIKLKEGLGIKNILQIAELCIAIPISNAESAQVFSFLWNVFSKNRQSLKNSSLEDILRLRCDTDFSDERYNHAIEMFWGEYPNGEVRKRPWRLDGIAYPSSRKSRKQPQLTVQIDYLNVIVLSDDEINDINVISDDEWSHSDNDK